MARMLSAVLPPRLDAARDFRTRFGAALARLDIDATSADTVLLVGSEIIVNIVQHSSPAATRIVADLSVTSSAWEVSIRDDGGTFTDIAEKVMEAGCEEGQALRESGMGLMLLNTHFPGWVYVPREADTGDNTLSYTGPLASRSDDRKRVLLVDDEQIQIDIVTAFLEETFDVVSALSVEQARKSLAEQVPDVILCDIRMPEIDGLEFRRQLRHSPRTSTIPFVFLTGMEREKIEAEADALAIDDFLTKPVDRARLMTVINRVMTRVDDLRASFGNLLDRGITDALVHGVPNRMGAWTCTTRAEAASMGGGDMIYHRKTAYGDLVVLIDVMGHGLPAKFYAHVLNGFLTGYLGAASGNRAPSELLADLSDAFAREVTLQSIIATAVAIAVRNDGCLVIASAGHAPPILLRRGSRTEIDVSGPLLGLAQGLAYEEFVLKTEPGDRFAVWTDGCVEVGEHGKHDAMEALFLSMIDATLEDLPAVALEQVFEQIFAHSPNGLADDATAIILSRDDR